MNCLRSVSGLIRSSHASSPWIELRIARREWHTYGNFFIISLGLTVVRASVVIDAVVSIVSNAAVAKELETSGGQLKKEQLGQRDEMERWQARHLRLYTSIERCGMMWPHLSM